MNPVVFGLCVFSALTLVVTIASWLNYRYSVQATELLEYNFAGRCTVRTIYGNGNSQVWRGRASRWHCVDTGNPASFHVQQACVNSVSRRTNLGE